VIHIDCSTASSPPTPLTSLIHLSSLLSLEVSHYRPELNNGIIYHYPKGPCRRHSGRACLAGSRCVGEEDVRVDRWGGLQWGRTGRVPRVFYTGLPDLHMVRSCFPHLVVENPRRDGNCHQKGVQSGVPNPVGVSIIDGSNWMIGRAPSISNSRTATSWTRSGATLPKWTPSARARRATRSPCPSASPRMTTTRCISRRAPSVRTAPFRWCGGRWSRRTWSGPFSGTPPGRVSPTSSTRPLGASEPCPAGNTSSRCWSITPCTSMRRFTSRRGRPYSRTKTGRASGPCRGRVGRLSLPALSHLLCTC